MESHVLLAVCEQRQCAHETTTVDKLPCGFFTNRLLTQLYLADLVRITYGDLLSQLLELINQKPQCEGENKNKFSFNENMAVWHPTVFRLAKRMRNLRYQLGRT